MIASATAVSDNSNDKKPASMLSHLKYEHLLAGVSAGLTSTLVLHPLDLLKIRFAVNDGQVTRPQYTGLGNAVVTILKEEGIQGLYRGVGPNCWGAGTAWGFYFLFYNSIKTWMLERKTKKELNAGEHMLAAAEAGILNLVMTNPIWVVKTRMCLQYANCNTTVPASKIYLGTFDALCKIYRHEGIKGLYKGFVPGVFGVSHGALQFMAYEEMKKYYLNTHRHRPDKKMGTLEYLSFAALSKLFAASITYPYQVVRARLQDQHKVYNGVIDVLTRTWRCEGMTGFFKGLLPSLLRVTPATAITFVVYEHVSQFLLRDK